MKNFEEHQKKLKLNSGEKEIFKRLLTFELTFCLSNNAI